MCKFRKSLYCFLKTVLLLICFSLLKVQAQNITRPNIKSPNGFEVNSYTGNLFHSRTDLRVAALPLPVDITFYYNQSRRNKNWGAGPGWTFTYNMAYTTDSLGIYIERGDGRRDLFKKVGNIYTSPAGVFDMLTEYATGKFKLTSKEGMSWYFDNAAHKKLTKIQDRNNNAISLSYTDSLLSQLTDMNGHTYDFSWVNGKLSEITDNCTSPIRKISYTYDTTGNPIKVTNPLGDFISYYYNAGKMVGYSDERDYRMSINYSINNAVAKIVSCITTQTFSYLAQQRKSLVAEMMNGQKQLTVYAFDTTGRVIHKQGNCCGYNVEYQYDERNDIISVKNGNNQTTKYEYDSRGNVIKETDALNNAVTYTYDSIYNRVKSIKDKRGFTTTYEYDAAGNRSKMIKPAGVTEKYTYDSKGNLATYTDGNNYKTEYEYNNDGFLSKQTDATGHAVSYEYDCHGNRTAETDARQNTTNYEYNALNQLIKTTNVYGKTTVYHYDKGGNLETVTNPLGKTTTYFYDGLNRRIKTVTPMGISTETVYDEQGNLGKTTDGNGNTTSYTYNSRKQVLTETDALGGTTSYEYDETGNQTSIRDKRGNTTRSEYDELNRLKKQINAMGGTIVYGYDAGGNRVTEKDANGNITFYEYDSLNRLKKITDPLNNTLIYTYNGANNRLSEKDKNGNYTYYTYDSLNRVKAITNALGGKQTMQYDENGNVISESDQLGHATHYTYDKLNRRLIVANAMNETSAYTYDDAGNAKTVTQPNGNVITSDYDDDNRLKKVVDLIGTVAEYNYDGNGNTILQKDGNGNPARFEYDAINRRVKQFDALNHAAIYTYDKLGNLLKETDRNGYPKSYTYDALNRRLSETDALSHITRFNYDANGNRLTIIDAKGNTTSYNYDIVNRLTKEIYADGTTRQFTYDANGNRKTRKDGKGVITVYTYDAMNRMLARSYPDGTADTYSYDSAGRRRIANNQNATITFAYDNANRMLSETLNGKTTGYAYNTATRIKMLTYPSGRVIVEERDKRDRLVAVKEDSTNIATFTYDNADRLTQKLFANGFSENYTYNTNNWLTALNCQPGNVLNFQYTYDNEGNKLTALKNHRPTHSEQYVYDSIYQLTGFYNGRLAGNALADTVSSNDYVYDHLHNRINSLEDNIRKNYNSNVRNAYKNVTGNNLNSTYLYDENGNLLTDENYGYQYDFENKLVSIHNGVFTRYLYDAKGRKIRSESFSDTFNYYYAGNSIIEEKNIDNLMVKKTYVYGNWLDDLLSYTNGGGTPNYAINNLQGSVLIVANNSGLLEYYEYNGFGSRKVYTSNYQSLTITAINNQVAFTGRPILQNGIYDFRARAYQNNNGRFGQPDPLGYVNGYNAYQSYFTPNDIDPYGLFSLNGYSVGLSGSVEIPFRFPTPILGLGIEFTIGLEGSIYSCCEAEKLQPWGELEVSASGAVVLGGSFKGKVLNVDKNGVRRVKDQSGRWAKKIDSGKGEGSMGPTIGIGNCERERGGDLSLFFNAAALGFSIKATYRLLPSGGGSRWEVDKQFNWNIWEDFMDNIETSVSVGLEGSFFVKGRIGTSVN